MFINIMFGWMLSKVNSSDMNSTQTIRKGLSRHKIFKRACTYNYSITSLVFIEYNQAKLYCCSGSFN